jgi:hypothetical protein
MIPINDHYPNHNYYGHCKSDRNIVCFEQAHCADKQNNRAIAFESLNCPHIVAMLLIVIKQILPYHRWEFQTTLWEITCHYANVPIAGLLPLC